MGDLTDVAGIRVGHAGDHDALTGCTVILCEEGAVAGVDVRGAAPGTRETDLLEPGRLIEQVHAILLAGGSAFGLAAAAGVMDYLEERGIGYDVGVARVPIVPAAVLFDLQVGRADVRPGPAMGRAAAEAARSPAPEQGNVGAGLGATVGKVFGPAQAMKGGLGTSSIILPDGLVVSALVVVNAFGEVRDPATGRILAGPRHPESGELVSTLEVLKQGGGASFAGNTTLGVVATNGTLDKAGANLVARMAHDGLARCIQPVHTLVDGDTLFTLATGERPAEPSLVGALAAEAVTEAVLQAIRSAAGLPGIPAAVDYQRGLP